MKMWIGNYDGERKALVIARNKTAARNALRGTSRADFDDHYVAREPSDRELRIFKPETMYTTPIDPGDEVRGWVEGRCPVRRPVGRPARAGIAAGQISVRVTDAERGAWERAARGRALAEWIRDMCNKKAAADP
jgi:hypothetical protein